MQRDELKELHYITPIDNLPSIAVRGLLSHHLARSLNAVSISKPEVQEIRRAKRVPQGRPLHDYVNLYICARNPMLYVCQRQSRKICVLSISTNVLDLPGVVVTDQNAASGHARFAAAPDGLAIVNKEMTFAKRWTHPDDRIAEMRHRSKMCAEVLVPDCIEVRHIQGIDVADAQSKVRLEQIGLGITIRVNRRLFFK